MTVEAADVVASGAKKAYHNHEAEIIAEDQKQQPEAVPGALGETT